MPTAVMHHACSSGLSVQRNMHASGRFPHLLSPPTEHNNRVRQTMTHISGRESFFCHHWASPIPDIVCLCAGWRPTCKERNNRRPGEDKSRPSGARLQKSTSRYGPRPRSVSEAATNLQSIYHARRDKRTYGGTLLHIDNLSTGSWYFLGIGLGRSLRVSTPSPDSGVSFHTPRYELRGGPINPNLNTTK
jgi:hypothetical protein